MPEHQPKEKKFELTPAVAILISGALVAGTILLTNTKVAGQPAVQGADDTAPSLQQQMNPSFYLALAKQLGVDEAKYQTCFDNKTHQAKIDQDAAEAQNVGGQGTPFTIVVDTKTGNMLPISGALPYEQIKTAIEKAPTEGTKLAIRTPSASEHIIGSPTAKTVLVEYSDFQCPFCQMIHPSLAKIVQEGNGDVAWVYRNFPLYQIHPQAEPAANAAECIAEQLGNTAFWQFANTIFQG